MRRHYLHPDARGFLYLVAVMDWVTRKVLAWWLSNTMDAEFCVEALKKALAWFGKPEIFNTGRGSQFTSTDFTDALRDAEVRISMDGRGRWMDNIFIERLWRSLKYECIYLKAFETGSELRAGLGRWIAYNNGQRPHSRLCGRTPDETYGQVGATPYPGIAPDMALTRWRRNQPGYSLAQPPNCPGRRDHLRLSGRVRIIGDHLQSLQPLVAARLLAETARCAGACGRDDEEHRDRQNLHQDTACGVRRKRGRSSQAIGRSRGGGTTKIHALTDVVIGRPYALMLTAGKVSDVKAAPALLHRAGRMRYLLGDRGYDADRLRRSLRDTGTIPVIPGRRNRKRVVSYDKYRYRGGYLIENAFCRLKEFRCVATRYDKLAANFLSAVALATAVALA